MIENEIKSIMTTLGYDFPMEDFKEKANWWQISNLPELSEDFIDLFNNEVSWLAMSKFHAINFSKELFAKYESRISKCKMNGVCPI